MSQKSSSNQRPWLNETYISKKKRSFELGKAAIDYLKLKKLDRSIKNIVEMSIEIDHLGKGIHANTIRSNNDLYNYYLENSNTVKKFKMRKKLKSLI